MQKLSLSNTKNFIATSNSTFKIYNLSFKIYNSTFKIYKKFQNLQNLLSRA